MDGDRVGTPMDTDSEAGTSAPEKPTVILVIGTFLYFLFSLFIRTGTRGWDRAAKSLFVSIVVANQGNSQIYQVHNTYQYIVTVTWNGYEVVTRCEPRAVYDE